MIFFWIGLAKTKRKTSEFDFLFTRLGGRELHLHELLFLLHGVRRIYLFFLEGGCWSRPLFFDWSSTFRGVIVVDEGLNGLVVQRWEFWDGNGGGERGR